ncbi:hypothetical protein KR018_009736, partial [Drosophila ironensis]
MDELYKFFTIEHWTPKCFLVQNDKIKKVLLYRFFFATTLSYVVDYILLLLFLMINQFDASEPLDSLNDILTNTFGSMYSFIIMLIARICIVSYGLILCKIHYLNPVCYRNRKDRIIGEFPLRCRLFFTIIFLSGYTSILYASFLDDETVNYWKLYSIFGIFCGIGFYFKRYNRPICRFQVPMMHFPLKNFLIQSWCLTLVETLQKAFVSTILFSIVCLPFTGCGCDGIEGYFHRCACVFTQPKLMLHGWLLSTLIRFKLEVIRKAYEHMLLSPLTLTCESEHLSWSDGITLYCLISDYIVEWNCRMQMRPRPMLRTVNGLAIPITAALDTSLLLGFRSLAAREFYDSMSGDMLKKLFVFKHFRKVPFYWNELAELLFNQLDDFMLRIRCCLNSDPLPNPCQALPKKVRKNNIRSLMAPPKEPTKMPSNCCCNYCCNNCWHQTGLEGYVYAFIGYLKQIGQAIRENILKLRSFLYRQLPELPSWVRYYIDIDPMAQLNHELQLGEPNVWILQAMARIFVRSAEECAFSLTDKDIARFFEILLNLEVQLAEVRRLEMKNRGKLCLTYVILNTAVRRCLYKML